MTEKDEAQLERNSQREIAKVFLLERNKNGEGKEGEPLQEEVEKEGIKILTDLHKWIIQKATSNDIPLEKDTVQQIGISGSSIPVSEMVREMHVEVYSGKFKRIVDGVVDQREVRFHKRFNITYGNVQMPASFHLDVKGSNAYPIFFVNTNEEKHNLGDEVRQAIMGISYIFDGKFPESQIFHAADKTLSGGEHGISKEDPDLFFCARDVLQFLNEATLVPPASK